MHRQRVPFGAESPLVVLSIPYQLRKAHFAWPKHTGTSQTQGIYLPGRCSQGDQAACNTEHQRTKIFAAHCTKWCPWESDGVCHAVLTRSLLIAGTQINLHCGLKGRNLQGLQNRSWHLAVTKMHPPLVSTGNTQGSDSLQEPSLSWIFLHNICQHTLTFSHLSVT